MEGIGPLDKQGKARQWHTAFYYLSRHLNYLSDGELTDKSFYGLVGINAPTLNHPNPQARKSTAASLSRTIHSNVYAKDMRELFCQDVSTFENAACEICAIVREKRGWGDSELSDYYGNQCWPDVWRGLANEKSGSRPSLNLTRIGQEAKLVFGRAAGSRRDMAELTPEQQLNAMLHILAFGYLDTDFMRALIPGTISSSDASAFYHGCMKPCLVQYSDESCTSFVCEWDLPNDEPFVIGRRTDSDSIESNMSVSGRHGCVYRLRGGWYFEDMRSLNGSTVIKRHERIELKAGRETDEELEPVLLDPGDLIVIAGQSCYWFGERRERSILPV